MDALLYFPIQKHKFEFLHLFTEHTSLTVNI